MARKRILTIDGGGIRGIIPLCALIKLEAQLGVPAREHFSFFAGTSTGGILALGLSCPDPLGNPLYTAADLAGLYEDRGGDIFHTQGWRRLLPFGNLGIR